MLPAASQLKARCFRTASFFGVWLVVFALMLSALYGAGLVPPGVIQLLDIFAFQQTIPLVPPLPERGGQPTGSETPINDTARRIVIPALGTEAPIVSPASADVDVLNAALTSGAVHYPGSASPGERGNVFLFAHSSSLPVVRNPAFRTFNRVQELKVGDVIRLQSDRREYWYAVTSMAERKADDAHIALASPKRLLTLSTCKVIGAQEDRYVVEAEFVESYPLRTSSAPATSS